MAHVRARRKHPHHDAPDTSAQFRRLAGMPEGPDKKALRQEVVRAWMPMAARLARRFSNRGEALEDLEQVAHLGLVKAVRRYDAGRSSAFESFAVPTIVGELKRHFRDHMWGVHVPRRVQELRNRVRSAGLSLAVTADDRFPATADIAEAAGLTEEEVRTGLEAWESYATLSLDAALPGTEDGYSLLDTFGSTEPGFDQAVDREAVRPHLSRLPEREREILYLRFFCDMTQRGIADHLGISQMHVSRLISHSCARVCERVEADRAAAGRTAAPDPVGSATGA
ncbi:SigB/SigF/SigG family RNA polymerase sigma factor [Streptomyces sp. CMB-StM0423]|uniref:SigB/SigF/SigG family RNA polymerase sigma factor n=1 Tax=Streptomyces sp. CMB-StM0423 TaxID=2059884 RepID=UPI000C714DBF|nr:SigB/SigF/SigG family RNA polymerase sigma factor [Streptomyces sp. CMB-StM0423]AUH43879.1 B/F/G family RNA polymerase sigma-70 factor [Streptomyces sp. CMB-StM0423]